MYQIEGESLVRRNEGETVYGICIKFLDLRERLRPYLRKVMEAAHEKGSPVMRTLFCEFPSDRRPLERTGNGNDA